jgi:hypothetical protein
VGSSASASTARRAAQVQARSWWRMKLTGDSLLRPQGPRGRLRVRNRETER